MTIPYKLRPADPVHAERGADLMAQWADEDAKADTIDLRATVDALGDLIEQATA